MADLSTIGFRADLTGINQAIKGLNDLLKQGGRTDRALGGASSSIGKAFAGIAAAVGGLASATSALQKLVSVTREFDVLNAGLITATGSAQKASQAFKAIQDFATTTPYSLAQATKAFTQLVNLGLTPSEAALTSYGNTAAAMGKDLSQMVEAVADATVGEFERLKEFGIKASSEGDRVSFTFRGMTTTVKKSADEIEGYLIGLGQNEFAGAMANRMNTLDGAISNLSDSWDGLFRTISSQGAGDLITSGIRMATDAISGLTDAIASGQLEGYLDAIGAKFNGWGADIASVLDFIGKLFADAGKFWYLDMAKSADLIVGAFVSLPENIKAFLQIATVEVAAFVDRIYIYAKKAANAMNPITQVYDPTADFAKTNQARAATIQKIMDERQASIDLFKTQIDGADKVRVAFDNQSASLKGVNDRLAQYKAETDKAAKSAGEFSKKIADLDEEMEAYTDSAIWLVDNESQMFESENISEMEEELTKLNKKVEEYATISEKAAERIEEAFADAWLNAFDGFESVVDGMKNAFKRMLAEMAHMALTKPIMVSMGLGGLLPSAASASTGALSGGLGLLGGIGSGITGLGSLIGGSFGGGLMGGGALVGAGQFGTLFSGAGSLLGSGNIMAGLGMATPIIAGLGAALAGIQKLSGGGLFGSSFKTTGQSLGLSLGGGDVTGSITTEESRKRSLFRGTKRRTTTTGYDASAIDDAFDAISESLLVAATTFGIEGADAVIKGFSSSVNIDIKDKTEAEIQDAIAAWVGSTTEGLVNAVFGDSLDGLQKEGEGVIDTVARLTANMGAVQSISKTLGLGFDLTGKAAMIASTNIVELAGGLDQLSALTSQYYSTFYSEAEQQQNLATQLAASFEALNVTMPMTREGFRSIVDGLDLTTESGQQMFAALMQLVPGMDQYLTALEAQRTASEQAAEAAQKEAEAKAAALKSQGLDMQLRLYDALGQSAEALAMRRQMELEATDETLRAILLQIYAAEDAASAQRELASAQDAAAQSARNAAAAATDAAQNAFGKLQDAAEREKSRLQTELDLKLESIDKEREALSAQRDSVVAGYEAQSDAVRDYISNLQGITEVINDFIGTSGGVVDPFKRLTQIFNEAKAGLIPNQSELQSVLGAIGSADSSRFASATDQSRAMAAARNQAAGIGQLIGGASGAARSQLGMLQTQISMAEDYYSQQMLKLDAASEQAKKLHDEQVGKIDEQLTEAQKQLNALLGVDDRILSMTDAMAEFYAALDKANELTLSVETAQLDALNRVESTVIGVSQGIADLKNDPRVWIPPTQPDRYTTNGEPISQEMVNLLNQILSAQESTAKHTAKTADTLQRVEMDGLDTRAVV